MRAFGFAGKVNVGKVDATQERALAARFGISAFPVIFYVSEDGEVVKYNGGRSLANLKHFATEGWEDLEKMPYWSSPHGLLGRSKGFIISSIYSIKVCYGTHSTLCVAGG